MRIVERARLGYREGRSDKVYEVDLVEVAPDQYVVNFRYGRRGSALRDGTKTPLPLALDKARVVFSALVAVKTREGYQAMAAAEPDAPTARVRPAQDAATRDKRTAQALVAALGLGNRSAEPLGLVVRKVSDRGLSEAEPALLELLAGGAPPEGMKPEVFRHLLVAALARSGSARSLPPLRAIADDKKAPRHLRDVARLALTMLGGEEERGRALQGVPGPLKPASDTDLTALVQRTEQLLVDDPKQAHAAIFALYIATPLEAGATGTEALRSARRVVTSIVRIARLTGPELGLLRTLNWAAELRRDGELFALLARRFETYSQDAKAVTVNYFRRRAGRMLRRLGSLGSPDYVKFASELLLRYRETDAEDEVASPFGTWDVFGRYHALNGVLYGKSPRYARADHRRATFRCQNGYTPGQPAPPSREESFPALWDRAPEALWRLGISEAAGVVIHFATRALREQNAYLAQIDDATLASAMAGAQRAMQLLAFDVARVRSPNVVLARGALAAKLDAADTWVLEWLEREPAALGADAELLALLVTAPSARVRDALPGLARALVLDADASRSLVARAIAILIGLADGPGENERAASATAFLLERASGALDQLSLAVLRDLLAHALSGVAELGAEILFRRARKGALEDGLLDALLKSPHARVRSLGARILADTPPAVIKDEPELLVHFALSENMELRLGTRPLFGEVARLYPDVGRDVASRLIDALLAAQPAGAPAHVVSLLRHELASCLPRRDAANVLSLIGALSPHAREAGGLLLGMLGPDQLELEAIVRLSSHEILMIRRGAWALALAAKDRFALAPIALSRLCDARWPDSRAFAFDFVKSFTPAVLVPDVVIAICDSIEPEVQRFGQALLLEHWHDDHAQRYLLRLAEHPSANIQLLVSGLLERHARGNLSLLEKLMPCLTSVLSQVNKGGVAKQRVLHFLRTEAVASAEAAALVAPLLERQSLTRAVSHKAPLIATLVDLHQRYPEVPVPISSPPVPLNSRGNRGV